MTTNTPTKTRSVTHSVEEWAKIQRIMRRFDGAMTSEGSEYFSGYTDVNKLIDSAVKNRSGSIQPADFVTPSVEIVLDDEGIPMLDVDGNPLTQTVKNDSVLWTVVNMMFSLQTPADWKRYLRQARKWVEDGAFATNPTLLASTNEAIAAIERALTSPSITVEIPAPLQMFYETAAIVAGFGRKAPVPTPDSAPTSSENGTTPTPRRRGRPPKNPTA